MDSQSGRYLFFTVPDFLGRTKLCMYEFATDRTKRLLEVSRTVEMKIAISPDGHTVVYPQVDEAGSDLMVVENFANANRE